MFTDSKKRTRFGVFFLLLLICSILYYNHSQQESDPISKTAFKLNTVITITIYDSANESLIDDAFALCDAYEAKLSRTQKGSEIYNLNNGISNTVSSETAELISIGLSYGKLSNGAFDITIEPLSSLWDFTSDDAVVPSQDALANAISLVNYQNVSFNSDQVIFSNENMGIDLGSIAKGYIADAMKDFLISKGVTSAIINLGGNILCIGSHPDGTPFEIGIQKPFADHNETIDSIAIQDQSVVSSGIYERFFEKEGTLYHHILNPETGLPYDNELISVTIISDKSVDGDALSTTCFALGLEKGMELINNRSDVKAIFITDDYELHYSEHFSQK